MKKGNEIEPPYQGHWYGDIVPEVAYHLEAQAGAVDHSQKKGPLSTYTANFKGLELREELGGRWYIAHHRTLPFFKHQLNIFAEDCDEIGIQQLRDGDPITVVHTPNYVPEAFDGRKISAIAAVFKGEEVLYRSPGCDLDLYKATPLNGLETLPKIDTSRELGTLVAKGIKRLLGMGN